MEKNSFILYTSYFDILSDLSNEQMGEIFRAILEYKTTKKQPVVSVDLKVVFKFIKNQLDLDEEKYNEKILKQSNNGKKGGAPKGNQNARKQPKTTQNKHNDNDNVNDNENDNDNDNDNVFLEKKEKEKKEDLFINPTITNFQKEYEKVFKTVPFLSATHRNKILELKSEIGKDFIEQSIECFKKLKNVRFDGIKDFNPNIYWLLKEDNYYKVLAGTYEQKLEDWQLESIAQEEALRKELLGEQK